MGEAQRRLTESEAVDWSTGVGVRFPRNQREFKDRAAEAPPYVLRAGLFPGCNFVATEVCADFLGRNQECGPRPAVARSCRVAWQSTPTSAFLRGRGGRRR